MEYVTFTENERLNIAILDNEHRQLADILNSLYNSFTKKNKRAIDSSIKKLLGFLRVHFDTEERMMKETEFFGYYSHKLEHDRFFNKVTSMSTGNIQLDEKELNNFKNWFYNHIELSDKKCGEHFAKRGLK